MKRVYAKAAMSPEVRSILEDPARSMAFIRAVQRAISGNKETCTACGLTLSRRRPTARNNGNE